MGGATIIFPLVLFKQIWTFLNQRWIFFLSNVLSLSPLEFPLFLKGLYTQIEVKLRSANKIAKILKQLANINIFLFTVF